MKRAHLPEYWLLVLLTGCQCGHREEATVGQEMAVMPGEGIGPIRLGVRRSDLPAGISIVDGVGAFEGIQVSVYGDRVVEVWVEDLRSLSKDLVFRGQSVDPQISPEDLKRLFGPCEPIPELIGGDGYDCAGGVRLGFGLHGQGVQLRLR